MGKSSAIRIMFSILLVMLVTSCSIKEEKITYGQDGCHYCSMTIVDRIHGAEIVTNKGKVFKFDAIECMVNYSKDIDENEISLYLCNHYETPEEFIDATKATFLISKNLPSPMGAYLTAFGNQTSADKIKSKKEGELFTWEGLLNHLKR